MEKVSTLQIPKRKPNHFIIYDNTLKKYKEIKYITQTELAEGYQQIIPNGIINKKLINHFSITLCFLPEHLWSKLKYNNDNYKLIKDGISSYSIIETNQDGLMIKLYKEIKKLNPDPLILNYLVNEIDDSQYTSWLLIRTKHYLSTGRHYESSPVNSFYEYKVTV